VRCRFLQQLEGRNGAHGPVNSKIKGYVITFAGCLIAWASKIQTEVAPSTTEAELIAMSEGLRTAIPLMNLIEEMTEHGIRNSTPVPECIARFSRTMQVQ